MVDEGSTLVLTSGRVSDRLQGQGLVKLMVGHLRRALGDEGRLAREAITTKGDNKQLQWRSLNQDYQHLLQRVRFNLVLFFLVLFLAHIWVGAVHSQ